MPKLVLPLLFALVVIVGIAIGSSSDPNSSQNNNTTSPLPGDESVSVTNSDALAPEIVFATPKKTSHFVNSDPAHSKVLSSVPKEVKISFDSELGVNSNIAITREGKDYSLGNTIVSGDRLNLSKAMQNDMPDGLYTVSYTACWPDGTCYDGSFQFVIKR
jgi:methionine-rich copper-binding protein CopC